MDSRFVKAAARQCGFELAGVAAPESCAEFGFYRQWIEAGFAGEMTYLTDFRGGLRATPQNLLPGVRSVVCVGKLYNGPEPYSTRFTHRDRAWISRYAWGDDYHRIVRRGLKDLAARLRASAGPDFTCRTAVDTAPLMERALARRAGLGWIGKNSCLINQQSGSWFFLGELLVSLELEPDSPPPDRCGTCTRCIDACPTRAIVPIGEQWTIDSRACISYFTIELRAPVPMRFRDSLGNHVFGCDICQDVCPWNQRAPRAPDPCFAARTFAPPLEDLAAISEPEFQDMFHLSPVRRARYAGFLRNVAVAMGNAGLERFRPSLERLAASPDPLVAPHARWALGQLHHA